VGKSSFLERIFNEDDRFEDVITYTTRPMRKGESEGDPYHFVSPEKFEQLILQGFFVEWAKVHSNRYGTPKQGLESVWSRGKAVLMDIDVQGAKTIKNHFPQALTVFILPPSINALRQRILSRDKETVQDLELRMENALIEMDQAEDFDWRLINDDFEVAFELFKKKIAEYLVSE
jgi:guanylate kinase